MANKRTKTDRQITAFFSKKSKEEDLQNLAPPSPTRQDFGKLNLTKLNPETVFK